jgi:acyl carrier protein
MAPDVERRLALLCQQLLGLESVDTRLTFRELGGDSLRLLQFVSSILKEFETGLSTAYFLKGPSLRAMAEHITAHRESRPAAGEDGVANEWLNTLIRPTQDTVTGVVPLAANRFSYFLRRRRNLTCWNVSTSVLQTGAPIDAEALLGAARDVMQHHDGLRLQATMSGPNGLAQRIVPVSEVMPLTSLAVPASVGANQLKRVVEAAVSEAQRGFSFPGDLFKVVHVHAAHLASSFLCLVAHHLAVDGYSFRMAVEDFFALYAAYAAGESSPLAAKTTSLIGYTIASTEYYRRNASGYVDVWRSLPWSAETALPWADALRSGDNSEGFTTYATSSMPLSPSAVSALRFAAATKYDFADTILAAVAIAFGQWTGASLLYVAVVVDGRESFTPGVDLSRTVGWISETVPMWLPTDGGPKSVLAEAHRQLTHAQAHGKSYGVIRYLSDDESTQDFRDHPHPEVSLNIIPPGAGRKQYSGVARPLRDYATATADLPDTERVFVLSGGAYFRDNTFVVSWDFSREVLDHSTVSAFAGRCMAEWRSIAALLGIDLVAARGL